MCSAIQIIDHVVGGIVVLIFVTVMAAIIYRMFTDE